MSLPFYPKLSLCCHKYWNSLDSTRAEDAKDNLTLTHSLDLAKAMERQFLWQAPLKTDDYYPTMES